MIGASLPEDLIELVNVKNILCTSLPATAHEAEFAELVSERSREQRRWRERLFAVFSEELSAAGGERSDCPRG